MSQRDELVSQLEDAGKTLGRAIDITGNAAELKLRLSELSEEIAALDDGDDEEEHLPPHAPSTPSVMGEQGLSENGAAEYVRVIPRKTLHIPARGIDSDESLTFAIAGITCRILASDAAVLREKNLIIEG